VASGKEVSSASNKDSGSEAADRKAKGALKYPPYVNAYGAVSKLFDEIQKASVPPKFTQDFMETVLELKSSSHRALIPLLKKLGFIDAANVPTDAYKMYRDPEHRAGVMANQIRASYADLYKANEYAHNLKKEELTAKLKALLGASEDDPNIPSVVGTFAELVKLADFKLKAPKQALDPKISEIGVEDKKPDARQRRQVSLGEVGLSYTINLNLPATTEIEVFNAIFKSLREHLLDG
jgi:hypothetical protein